MLSLTDLTPEEMRAIADFLETQNFDLLVALRIRPVVEWGGTDGPDRLIGYERCEADALVTQPA